MSGYQNESERQKLLKADVISVRCIEARGVKAADFGGTSDPFVEVRIKGHTEFKKNTSH